MDDKEIWAEINRLRERDILRESDLRHLGAAAERIEASVERMANMCVSRKECEQNHRTQTKLSGVWWGVIQAILTAVAVAAVMAAKGGGL